MLKTESLAHELFLNLNLRGLCNLRSDANKIC